MKNLNYIIILIFCLQVNNYAQPKNGTFTVGGQINFGIRNSTSENDPNNNYTNRKTSNLSISPRFGYFSSDNIEIGIGVIYSRYKHETEEQNISSNYTSSNELFSINPFIRWYNNFNEHLGIHVEFDFSYGFGTKEEDLFDFFGTTTRYTYDLNSLTFSVNPGISYHVNDKISFEVTIGGINYSRLKSKLTKPDYIKEVYSVDEDYGFSFSFKSLSLGFQYNL